MPAITDIRAHEILDSRGIPTLSVSVHLAGGAVGVASVPAGASTGHREAVELRDGDAHRYRGLGVLKAVSHVRERIAHHLRGMDVREQARIDAALRQIDGTPDKAHLGANALLGVSLAVARAAAIQQNVPLYYYIARLCGQTVPPDESTPYILPAPMITMINGGTHANNTLDCQEFMIVPIGAPTFAEAVRYGSDVFQALKDILGARGFATSVGDGGGFAPNLKSHDQALDLIVAAIRAAGYRPERDVVIALDMAASELFKHGSYVFKQSAGSDQSAGQLIEVYRGWKKRYPLFSIEDGMDEHDNAGWLELTRTLGGKLQLVGDDLFVTHPALLAEGIKAGLANAVIIEPNQVGTLSETLEAIRLAREAKYAVVVAGRSGETEDTFVADLAVGSGAGQIKVGSLCRSERTAKYNRLLTIERELGAYAVYGGKLLVKPSHGGPP